VSDQTPPGGGEGPPDERPSAPPPPAPPPPAAFPPPSYPGSAPPPGAPPPSAPPPPGPPPGSAPPAPPYGSAQPYGSPSGGYYYDAGPADRFGRPLAGWWQRFGAILIDLLILGIPASIIERAAIGSSGYTARFHVGLVLLGLLFAVVDLVYFALLNGSQRGQTVGQMALGIAVRDSETGGAIDPQRAGLRIFVLLPGILLDWIPFIGLLASIYTIIAGLSPLWDSQRHGFHDKVARTDVIRVR
jgi:uncharacterized RDD family membrane protein YckC